MIYSTFINNESKPRVNPTVIISCIHNLTAAKLMALLYCVGVSTVYGGVFNASRFHTLTSATALCPAFDGTGGVPTHPRLRRQLCPTFDGTGGVPTHSHLWRQLCPAFDVHRGELSHNHVCGGNYIQSLTYTGEYRGILSLCIVMISHDAQSRF